MNCAEYAVISKMNVSADRSSRDTIIDITPNIRFTFFNNSTHKKFIIEELKILFEALRWIPSKTIEIRYFI